VAGRIVPRPTTASEPVSDFSPLHNSLPHPEDYGEMPCLQDAERGRRRASESLRNILRPSSIRDSDRSHDPGDFRSTSAAKPERPRRDFRPAPTLVAS